MISSGSAKTSLITNFEAITRDTFARFEDFSPFEIITMAISHDASSFEGFKSGQAIVSARIAINLLIKNKDLSGEEIQAQGEIILAGLRQKLEG